VLVAAGDTIESMHLPPSLQMKQPGTERKKKGTLQGLVESYERALITDTLKDVRGNMSKAAKTLGSTKRIIQYKVLKYGIDPLRFKAKK